MRLSRRTTHRQTPHRNRAKRPHRPHLSLLQSQESVMALDRELQTARPPPPPPLNLQLGPKTLQLSGGKAGSRKALKSQSQTALTQCSRLESRLILPARLNPPLPRQRMWLMLRQILRMLTPRRRRATRRRKRPVVPKLESLERQGSRPLLMRP
mmetsp:Transcript_70995/g.201174  ORF Transcript_70995/g.201174 Transcript_70995/m.201174 type:complete len:154 (+) Transcript_70995:586-1047(+)